MKFEIRRTSINAFAEHNPSPCEEAHPEPVDNDWADRDHLWFVDIKTLEELIELSDKYGSLIVNTKDDPDIEIYDDYRE